MIGFVASLGMYDHPAQHGANDRIWAGLARALRAQHVEGVPDALDRDRRVQEIWRDPALLFGQACGYPLTADASLSLRIVALPLYDTPGCGDATHTSVLVARAGDGRGALGEYRGGRAAINDRQSNTGMNLFRATLAPIADASPFFHSVVETGSHQASVAAVARGTADIAAIDAVTYATLVRYDPELTAPLKIVARSPASPTLPFVTASGTGDATLTALRIALDRVMADPDLAEDRRTLRLAGIAPPRGDVLAPIRAIEKQAQAYGYPDLR